MTKYYKISEQDYNSLNKTLDDYKSMLKKTIDMITKQEEIIANLNNQIEKQSKSIEDIANEYHSQYNIDRLENEISYWENILERLS